MFLSYQKNFKHRVDEFLDLYVEENQDSFDATLFRDEFEKMIAFVAKYFPLEKEAKGRYCHDV